MAWSDAIRHPNVWETDTRYASVTCSEGYDKQGTEREWAGFTAQQTIRDPSPVLRVTPELSPWGCLDNERTHHDDKGLEWPNSGIHGTERVGADTQAEK